MDNMAGINPTENWDNYEKDKKVIERVTGNIEQNLKNMRNKEEADLVSKIQGELQAIKNNIENPDNLRNKWDDLSLRQVEGAKAYLGTVEQKDINGQYTMCVMAVQTLLQDLGYLKNREGKNAGTEWIDGLYGDRSGINKTKEAIKDFQEERNQKNSPKIHPDGKINYQTIQALLKKKEKTDTEQQTTEQEKNKEKLRKVTTMTFQELIEEGLTNKDAIMNLAQNAGETNYQIPTSVENNLKIIEYINDEDINSDIENLNINQDTSRATMKQIKEITEAIEAACGKQGKNLLDQISKIQDSTIRAKADANYNKIWNILKERNGKLSEYKDQRINAYTINNLKQDFIILKDALNRDNYDAKGNPIDKTKPYFTDKKDVDTYCTKDPQQVLSNLKKLAQAEKAPKIKQKEENGKTEEKSLNLRWGNFIRSNKPQSEELIIQCFNDTTFGKQLNENKILYEEGNQTQISRGESNGDNIRDDTQDIENNTQDNTHEQEDQNQNNPEIEVENETQPTQEEETEDKSEKVQEDPEKKQKKSELQNLINPIKESEIDDEVGDPAKAYKSALEEARNTLKNSESTKENYESAKTTLEEKKNAYETAYQTEKETALEELETVLNGINIYTVDQNIDSEGEYLQAITTANNINKETASLQEIKEAKKELEEAKEAYEEAKKQAEENTETEKWKDFQMSADKKTLEKYKGNGGEVQIPDGVEHISDNAFKNQEGITKITLPNTLQTIGRRAFNGCTKLQEIIIPDSIQTIGYRAFTNTGINSITLRRSVQYIGATGNKTAFKNKNDVATNLFGSNSEKITITFQD